MRRLNDVVAAIVELLHVLTEPGERVVINPPVYHPFFGVIEEAGRELAEVPLADGRELDLDGIERSFAAGARVLVLCSPHNPTGAVLERAELERIAEVAAAHDGWVLADEIHAPLVAHGRRAHRVHDRAAAGRRARHRAHLGLEGVQPRRAQVRPRGDRAGAGA